MTEKTFETNVSVKMKNAQTTMLKRKSKRANKKQVDSLTSLVDPSKSKKWFLSGNDETLWEKPTRQTNVASSLRHQERLTLRPPPPVLALSCSYCRRCRLTLIGRTMSFDSTVVAAAAAADALWPPTTTASLPRWTVEVHLNKTWRWLVELTKTTAQCRVVSHDIE